MRTLRFGTRIGCALLVLAAAAPRGALAGAAYLQITGGWRKAGDSKQLEQKITLSNARVDYQLQYDVSVGPDTPKGRCFSTQWVYTIGVPSLGMTQPTTCNWYSQGFLDVQVDGESLKDYPATIVPVRAGGPDALATATWKTDKGVVRVHFLLRAGDDKLVLRAEWDCAQTPTSVVLRALCYPSWFYGDKDRWAVTAQREVQHTKTLDLDVAAEPWIFYHDRAKPPPKAYGACALMYCPEEAAGAQVQVQSYPNWTTVSFKPETGHGTIALWDFTGAAMDDESLAYLRKAGPAILNDLQAVAGADWTQPFTEPVKLPPMWAAQLDRDTAFQPTPFDAMTPTVETDHVKWAKPLAGGPAKVLVIAPRWSQREVVELAQRFDVQYEVASVDKPSVLFEKRWMMLYGSFQLYGYRDRSVVTMLGELLDKIRGDYDCIIVADVNARILPKYFVDLLAQKVQEGTGMIAIGGGKSVASRIGKGPPAEFTAHVPLHALPVLRDFAWDAADGKPLAQTYKVGKGRVLVFGYPVSYGSNMSLTPNTTRAHDFVIGHYGYYHSLLMKAILWAAKREPAARIEGIDLEARTMQVRTQGALDRVAVEVHAHDASRRAARATRQEVSLRPGASTVLLNLHAVGGEQMVDVTLSRDGEVLDWASTTFDGPTSIKAIDLDKTVYAPGEVVKGAVQLQGPKPGDRLHIEIVDSKRRIVQRQVQRLAGGVTTVPFAMKLDHPLTVAHLVRATCQNADGATHLVEREITVPNQKLDDFMFLMWSKAHNSKVRLDVLRELEKGGVDTLDNVGLTGADGPTMATACRNAAWANLRSVPYITRIASRQTAGTTRKPCLTDPKHLESWTAGLRERAKAAAPYGPPAHTLGDENFLVNRSFDVCFSPTCKAGFRQYLKEIYGTLDALNAEWQTQLGSWDEAEPIAFKEAKETNQLPRWVDHRRYMERVFTNAHALGRKVIQEEDPGARVGFDGVFSLDSWHGYDYYQLTRACDLNQVYASRLNQLEYMRSFGPKDALQGAWHNRIGNADEVSAKRVPWHLLFNGFNSSWYWMSYETGPAALFPDLRPTPQMQWMTESHNEIKAGIGKLIMNSQRQHDGVAIHYSQASVHGNTILGRKLPDAHFGALHAIEDLGLQYDFVAYEQIEAGALDGYKVLVMPASCAVSKKEVAAIREFVSEGGLAIADVYPAVMDGHCKVLKAGALDDVFGMRVSADLSAPLPEADSVKFEAKPFGRGRAVLMGYPLSEYRKLRNAGKETAFREALRAVVDAHGVTAQVKVTADGQPVSACEVVRFEGGDIEYVGIVSEDNVEVAATVQATITFPSEAHVYDVRAKQYLGRVSRVETALRPGEPLLYARLPYTVDRVALAAGRGQYRAGEVVALRATIHTSAGRLAGGHVVRVEAAGPDGQEVLQHYSQNVLTTDPGADVRIPLALNDAAGAWRFTATDVVSGSRGEAVVQVRPAQ